LVFKDSRIYWLEIITAPNYEHARPGVHKRIAEYNAIIEDVYGEGMVYVKEKMMDENGLNSDGIHWNTQGHKVISEIILDRINCDLKDKEKLS